MPHASTASPVRALTTMVLSCVGALAIGYAGLSAWQHYQRSTPAQTGASWALLTDAADVTPWGGSRWAPVPAPAPVAAQLRAEVVYGNSRYGQHQQLALPSGAAFHLALHGDRAGSVQVQTISPDGRTSTVWSGRLRAGQERFTPRLALQGTRGMEALRIVFQPADTAGLPVAPTVRVLQLLHV